MNALTVGEQVTLVFTTVLDELSRGLVDEDEEVQAVTDRAYWDSRGTKATVKLADELLEIIREFDSGVELKYNKFYIGLAKDGRPNNIVSFRAKKNHVRLELRLKEAPDTTDAFEQAGLDLMDYDKRWSRYRVRITKEDIGTHRELLSRMMKTAYDQSNT